MKKLAEHGDGIAMVFARTETQAFFDHVWGKATGILFLKGRVKFWRYENGMYLPGKTNAGAPSVLISYDKEDSWDNAAVLQQCKLPGFFVDLTPYEVVWSGWKAALVSLLRFGPLTTQELYYWVGKSVHRPGNRHIEAKIRQTLNRYDDVFESFQDIDPPSASTGRQVVRWRLIHYEE